MTEHKFTDEEVIKALECCAVDPHSGIFADCKNCPLDHSKIDHCFDYEIQIIALDLINRQRAEIADLKDENKGLKETNDHLSGEYIALMKEKDNLIRTYAECQTENIKEFAERLKEIKVKYALPLLGLQTKDEIECYVDDILLQMRDGIDALVKEMTEGEK